MRYRDINFYGFNIGNSCLGFLVNPLVSAAWKQNSDKKKANVSQRKPNRLFIFYSSSLIPQTIKEQTHTHTCMYILTFDTLLLYMYTGYRYVEKL